MADTSKSEGYLVGMDVVREKRKKNFFLKCGEINGSTIDLSDFVYTGSRGRSKCRCKICGYVWEDTPEVLYKRTVCPECHKKKQNEETRKVNLLKHKLKAEKIYKNHNISDIEFYYDEKSDLMVRFYCHETYCDGTEHGLQVQTGWHFFKGGGCAKCATNLSKAYTTEEWVKLAQNKHPEFTYDKTIYLNKNTKVTVTCAIHGDFLVNPKEFVHGTAYCPKCREEKNHAKFVQKVIKRAQKAHKDDDYIYHPELITKSTEKMGVECKKHGIFWQSIGNHINLGCRCPQCVQEESGEKSRISFDEIVEKARAVHGDKYVYHEDKYVKTMDKTVITCPIHGDFEQTMHNHLAGQGCPKCGAKSGGLKIRLTQEEFLERALNEHKYDNFDYSRAVYKSSNEDVEIGCPKHGFFKVNAMRFLNGQGCPVCRLPKLEKEVRNILMDKDVIFESQKRFPKWLGMQSLDFYLPEYNIAIECQGMQHFKNERGYQDLDNVIKRDKRKKRLCAENGVKLIYYVPEFFSEYMKEDDIFFTNVKDLCQYIQEGK